MTLQSQQALRYSPKKLQLEILRKCRLVWQVYYPELRFPMWVQFRLTTALLLIQLLACFPVRFVGMTVPVRLARYVHDPVKTVQGSLFFDCLFTIPVNPNSAKGARPKLYV